MSPAAALGLLILGMGPLASAVSAGGTDTPRLIVRLQAPIVGSAAGRIEALGRRLGVVLHHGHRCSGGVEVVTPPADYDPGQLAELVEHLNAQPEVSYAEVDAHRYPVQVPPADPEFNNQGYLSEAHTGINTLPAWVITTGSADTVVALVDTGILAGHVDLAGHVLAGYDLVSTDPDGSFFTANDGDGRDPDPSDPGDGVNAGGCGPGTPATPSSWHGTGVASLVGAAQNGAGMVGVDWQTRLLPVRALGRCGGYVSDINDALRWAAGLAVPGVPDNPHPARVINLSIGSAGTCLRSEQAAIDDARAAGALVVVSAGNDGRDTLRTAPANCRGVLVVTATDRNGGLASFADFGVKIGLSAPGTGILVATNSGLQSPIPGGDAWGCAGGSPAGCFGTSFATPLVSGVAALMLSLRPDLSVEQLIGTLRANTHAFPGALGIQCSEPLCGTGIADAAGAVSAVRTGRIDAEAEGNGLAAALRAATPLGFDSPIRGRLTRDGQIDLYRVQLGSRQRFRALGSGGTDTYAYLFGSDATVIAQNDNRSTTDTNFEIQRELDTGTYYLGVEGRSRSSRGDYVLTISHSDPVSGNGGGGGGGGGALGWPTLLLLGLGLYLRSRGP